MIKKLRLLLEYRCYPVWMYDENDEIVDTLLPEELRSDQELDAMFDRLQERYDALFINTDHEFSFRGFSSDKDREKFLSDWEIAVEQLKLKAADRYQIIDDLHLSL